MALLLTATVNPGDMVHTALRDPVVRRQQYLDAIRFWLQQTHLPIVFVENSGNDLSGDFKDAVEGNRIQFLTFEGNSGNRQRGKGYGELGCMEYGFAHSPALRGADFVFKVTGRLQIPNFGRFYRHLLRHPGIRLLIDFKLKLSYADSRLYGFAPPFFFTYLLPYKEAVNDAAGIYFEHVLAKAALKAIAEEYQFSALPALPRYTGTSGTYNTDYTLSPFSFFRNSCKYKIKYLVLSGR